MNGITIDDAHFTNDQQSDETLTVSDRQVLKETWMYFRKVNRDIGRGWTKNYLLGAMWSNVNTPLNLTITLLSALTTGEVATTQLLSTSTMLTLSVTTLLLSTVNTFFTPERRVAQCSENARRWARHGATLEELHLEEAHDRKSRLKQLDAHRELFNKTNELRRNNSFTLCADALMLLYEKISRAQARTHWLTSKFIQIYKWDSFGDAPTEQQREILVRRWGSHEAYMLSGVWLEPEFAATEKPILRQSEATQTNPLPPPSPPSPPPPPQWVRSLKRLVRRPPPVLVV